MRIKLRACLSLGFLGIIGVFGATEAVRGDAPVTEFSISFAVANEAGQPVVSDRWVEAQVAAANRIFAPAGVRFVLGEIVRPAMDSQLVTRADRHRLGPLVDPERGVIHAFAVQSMDDVDVPGRPLRGVHWRSRRGGGYRHFVVVTSIAGENVLAHELGHFFGNPHSPTPGNIMSYARGEGPPFFDEAQLRRIRRFTQRFIRSGELRATP